MFTIDVKSHGGNVVSHITSDNVEAGRLAGDFVAQRLPPGSKVGIIDGPPISTFQQRVEGFTQAINGKLVSVLIRTPCRILPKPLPRSPKI